MTIRQRLGIKCYSQTTPSLLPRSRNPKILMCLDLDVVANEEVVQMQVQQRLCYRPLLSQQGDDADHGAGGDGSNG